MSIFSGLFRSRDKPTDSTTGSTYRFLFGGTTSGKAVTERSAMLDGWQQSAGAKAEYALAEKLGLDIQHQMIDRYMQLARGNEVTVLDTVYRAHPVTGELIIAGTDQPWRKSISKHKVGELVDRWKAAVKTADSGE